MSSRVSPKVRRDNVLNDVDVERNKQDDKWGEQHHPDGTYGQSQGAVWASSFFRDKCDAAAKDGTLTWRHILLEEIYEALAESSPERLREELVQSAAVLVGWIEDIDSRS